MPKSPRFTLAVLVLLLVGRGAAHAQTPTVLFGERYAAALKNNGDVLTWGYNLYCQLGRPTRTASGVSGTPTLVMRNAKSIALSGTHNFAVTTDGKAYAWGSNPDGTLGMGHEYELCEGPEPVTSLAGQTITQIATGYSFAVAVSAGGDLFCAGDNEMGQCPGVKGETNVFVPVALPELKGRVQSVVAGMFHVLVLTRDRKLYAFGRGRDGQLGPGPLTNGFRAIPELADVVSLAAGTWHSAAVLADGTAWVWGNGAKAQLCDGGTANKATPVRVPLPGGAKATDVYASGHATVVRTSDGALVACGDNQFGPLGVGQPMLLHQPTPLPVQGKAVLFSLYGANSAVSVDGCTVRMSGLNDSAVLSEAPGAHDSRVFVPRANLTLCGPAAPAPATTLVREYPTGGRSGCWTPYVEMDASKSPKYAALRQAMLAGEAILKRNAAFMASPQPSRFRTALSAGPYDESGARMHIKVVPERKGDRSRLWTGDCDVIPQVDRIGGAIAQVSIFYNTGTRSIVNDHTPPKLTGSVGGFPEYEHWVVITKNGRLPWVPQTLADRLDAIGARRDEALAEWKKDRANDKLPDMAAAQAAAQMMRKTDPAGADTFLETMQAQIAELKRRQQAIYPAQQAALEKQVADFKTYRASFTADQLRAPAVQGDPTGDEKRRMETKVAALRAQSNARGIQDRTLRAEENERVGREITDLMAQYELVSLKPGPAEKAIGVKPDPGFPSAGEPNRIQMILVAFSEDPDPKQVDRRAWQDTFKHAFDVAALAALLQ